MKYKKKRKSFVSLVCALLMLLSVVELPVEAADTNRVTASTATSVKQGNYGYCYVSIDSTEELAALEVSVYFDPAKVKIVSVYNRISCTMYDSAVNVDHVRFSYLFDGKGEASKTSLFYFRYQVLSNAEVGTSYFDITIGEAYDKDLQDVAVSGSRCSFTIAESVTNKSCSVYGTSSVSTAVQQEFTLDYNTYDYEIASGTIVLTYDPELFEVVEAKAGRYLKDKVVDINTELKGEIYLSFVGTARAMNSQFLSVTFRTIQNADTTSSIVLKTPELLDKDLNAISCNGYTSRVAIAFDKTYVGDAPVMRLDGSFSHADKQITLKVTLEKDSKLGAGDFVLAFDPNLVTYRSSTKEFTPSYYSVDERHVEEGVLKFHIVSLTDIMTEETVLTAVFDMKEPYQGATADFALDGTGLTDSMTESILLNMVDTAVPLTYQVQFCDEDGTVLQSNLYRYGEVVTEPKTPTKESDEYGTYTFAGWDKEVTPCNAEVTYRATYELTYTDYTVTFKNWDDSEISKATYHYGDTVTVPENPSREADKTYTYIFNGWDKEVTDCKGNATYTATYKPTYIDYTVMFQDWDGRELSKKIYHYGDTVTVPKNPSREADKTYTYTFHGWDKEVTDCKGNATYTATYKPTYIEYTVIFADWDGSELSKETYHYGDKVVVPVSPNRESDERYIYTFTGWNQEISPCRGDVTYTAQYRAICGHFGEPIYVKTKAATCTTDGCEAYWICEDCGLYFADVACTEVITEPKTIEKHKGREVKAVASTYTKPGTKQHYRCSCGKLYLDKTCKKQVTKTQLTVPVKKLTLSKPTLKKVTAKKKALAITWSKKSSVTGYEVQVALGKSFKKGLKKTTIKGAGKTNITVKKLKAKKTYYVRIRTYKIVEGKRFYSSWSTVKKGKTK